MVLITFPTFIEIEENAYGEDIEIPGVIINLTPLVENKTSPIQKDYPTETEKCEEDISINFDLDDGGDDDDNENHAILTIMNSVKRLSYEKRLCPRVTFLDFAGQSVYYAFHQIYLSPKTIYILVVDMTKRLSDEVPETDENCCSRFECWTYEGTC